MSAASNRSTQRPEPIAADEIRNELARELALYQRLDSLADQSLALLSRGENGTALLPILGEKRRLLGEIRDLQERTRCDRETWHRRRHEAGEIALAEFDRVTAEMESVLRGTIRKEEEVDLRLRTLRIPVALQDANEEAGRIARVG